MAKKVGVKHGVNLLTDAAVRAFKGPGRLNDGAGLSLVVTRDGFRRWIYRFTFGGKQRDLFLGSTLTLKAARVQRDKAKAVLASGYNPADTLSAKARKMQQAVAAGVPTFGTFADTYLTDLSPTLKDAKARQPWELALKVYAKPLHDQRLNTITSTDVAAVLRPIWQTKKETARRLRWRLEAVFSAAAVAGYREKDATGQVITVRNPAAWKGNLDQLPGFKAKAGATAETHHAAMDYRAVPAFMAQLRGMEGLAAKALELAILTAARTGEAIGCRWNELDLEAGLWTIPAARMKAGRAHEVPLSKPALDLLKAMPHYEASPYVFPGTNSTKHLSNMALLMLLRRAGLKVTAHGFRSSFRTWAAECTTFPREIAEMALAHRVGTDVERAYNRTTLIERRRALADAWAAYCEPQGAGNVVELQWAI